MKLQKKLKTAKISQKISKISLMYKNLVTVPTSRESLKKKQQRTTTVESSSGSTTYLPVKNEKQKTSTFLPTIQIGTFNESTTNYRNITKLS